MPLSKEQKEQLTEELKGFLPRAEFRIDGHNIAVQKVRVSENKTALAVYIDGKVEWKNVGVTDNKAPDIVTKVWRKRSHSLYKPTQIKRIEKAWGKRRAKQEFPNLHKTSEYYDPTFNTASTLVRQFAKLEGIEVVQIGRVTEELA